MDEVQKMVSEYVRNNSPVPEIELRNYLRGHEVPENEIKRILEDEIKEHFPSEMSILSPFDMTKLSSALKFKTLNYDENILVREIITKGLTGLIPSDTKHSCLKPSSPTGPGLLPPPPDTEIPIIRREYFFCPTKEDKLRFLQRELYQ